MLKFLVYENGKSAKDWRLRHAHMVGADDIGVRSTVSFSDGMITCEKNAVGSGSLVVQFDTGEMGDLVLQTCLLPERDEPYLLSLELARHRLMKMIAKQEDWAMIDLEEDHPANKKFGTARKLFIEALSCAEEPAKADELARKSLAAGIDASEELALAHAEMMVRRRKEAGQLGRTNFGCGVSLTENSDRIANAIKVNFDFVCLPTPWRVLEPAEQDYKWQALDAWCEWALKQHVPVIAGPLVSFHPAVVPDWLYIWEHDYDTIRDLLYEHIERVVKRYSKVVNVWNVVSGVHVNNHFSFNFEQLMDLTRMSVVLVKKVQPNARTMIELTHPFGEYYAFNQRSIPPLMYAEMILQTGIPFDALGIKLLMGQPHEGQYTRDLMQVSAALDRYTALGKPVVLTRVAVPASSIGPETAGRKPPAAESSAKKDGGGSRATGGYWRKPWSHVVQGHWLEALYNIALSKPVVESVSWLELADRDGAELPHAGLITSDFQSKSAFARLSSLRKSLQKPPPAGARAGADVTAPPSMPPRIEETDDPEVED